MTVSIQTLLSGDTGYIGKHNANYAAIKSAVETIQNTLGNTAQANLTAPLGFEAQFGSADCYIGSSSYVASVNSTTDLLTVGPGFAWIQQIRAVISNAGSQSVSFTGFAAGTYYVHMNPAGTIYVDQVSAGKHYSVHWDGSSFDSLTRFVAMQWSMGELMTAATSTALAATYSTLDARLEAGEALAQTAVANSAAGIALRTHTSKSVAGSANVTLTAGEAAAAHIILTGALTGNITVLVPLTGNTPKLLSVANNTTGNFEINFKGTTQVSNCYLPQGYTSTLVNDGTNIYSATTDAYVVAKVVPYAATITLDWSKYDTAHITLTGNATITHTGARPGQKCLLYIAQDAVGGRLVTWTAEVAYGTDISGISLTSTAEKTDEVGFSYNWVASKYNVVSIAKGY